MSTEVTTSEFRKEQSRSIDVAQREPVLILSRGSRRRAVVVSPDFYDRAIEALEDMEDIRAAAAAHLDDEEMTHDKLQRRVDKLRIHGVRTVINKGLATGKIAGMSIITGKGTYLVSGS